jgi:hypothetical protein
MALSADEKIELLASLQGPKVKIYYDTLEQMGDLKTNYTDYMLTAPVDVDYELRRLPGANYDLLCALFTMILREDYFSNGSFRKRYGKGQVQEIIQRMVSLLKEEKDAGIRMEEVRDEDKKALEDFLLDINCLDALRPWTDKFNLFDVLKISNAEIRHSNMLAWLLSPEENHGFGDRILAGLLQKVVQNDTNGRYDICQLLLMNLNDFYVAREWRNIDILLTSEEEKTVIAVENKIWTAEHDDQLKRYRSIIEKTYADYPNKVYLYLTPDGDDASDPDTWLSISYSDIADIISTEMSRNELNPDVEVLVRNYVEMLRREIVNDQELDDICNKIYRKHGKALDLLFAHRVDPKAKISNLVAETLSQLDEDGQIHQSAAWVTSFHTDKMSGYLKNLEADKGSWKSGYPYYYWFAVNSTGFYAIFELGGFDLSDDEMNREQQIIEILKPTDKRRESFQYKRVYKTKPFQLKDNQDPEESIPKAVRAAVKNILDMEEQLMKKLRVE